MKQLLNDFGNVVAEIVIPEGLIEEIVYHLKNDALDDSPIIEKLESLVKPLDMNLIYDDIYYSNDYTDLIINYYCNGGKFEGESFHL